jgi:pectate lyase
MHRSSILLPLLVLSLSELVMAQPIAFPGAQGWGANSAGGRGGTVIEVTNLNDSGPGSFREACIASGSRTIVFRTGGVIDLAEEIQIFNPFITIAGQTAPGDGIVLKNFPISVFTHDVIIRGLRIRIGDALPTSGPDNRDCISIQSGSYNVIIDHCSFSWAIDENVSILNPGVHGITVQWSIVSEGLFGGVHPKGLHSMGILVSYNATQTSIHHNLFAHNGGRNPLILGEVDHEFVNNIVYDWGFNADMGEQGIQFKLDFRGNYYKPRTVTSYPELPLNIDFDHTTTLGSRLHMVNNFFSPDKAFITAAQLAAFGADAAIFSSTSLLSTPSSIVDQSAQDAYSIVLDNAGALHPARDATDMRVVQSVRDSTGGLIDCMDASPRLLNTGQVISATSGTIRYSNLGKPNDYSAESRKIVITGGTGVGQIRYGAEGTPVLIDAGNLIYEAALLTPWTTVPDATSTYEFYARCMNNLGGYPTYGVGSATTDTDHDGMPDAWESMNGLSPNNAADRNFMTLDAVYTNLEVYLNEFYPQIITAVDPHGSADVRMYPNPWRTTLTIEVESKTSEMKIILLDRMGREVMQQQGLIGNSIKLDRGSLVPGLYLLLMLDGNKRTVRKVIVD